MRKGTTHILACSIVAAMILGLFTGCAVPGKNNGQNGKFDSSNNRVQSKTVHVNSAKELLEAVAPKKTIILEPGYYNLSEYMENVNMEKWNELHPYLKLEECYDGVDAVVQNVDNLTIKGDGKESKDTELVVDPRYAKVLNFSSCKGIRLSNMTMGHTQLGDCSGNVIDIYHCTDLKFRSLDLYGCGVCGVGIYDYTENFYMKDSKIHDCEFGPFDIYNCAGDIIFESCSFVDNEGAGYYSEMTNSKLAFKGCEFGSHETLEWYYREDALKEDCSWDEEALTQEAEQNVSDGSSPQLNKEAVAPIPLDAGVLNDSGWVDVELTDRQTGAVLNYPMTNEQTGEQYGIYAEFYADGSGYIAFKDGKKDFNWSCDDKYVASIKTTDGISGSLSLYSEPTVENTTQKVWMRLEYDGKVIWFY